MRRISYLLIIFMILMESSFSGTIDPNVSDNKYIEYGQKFDYVIELCGSYQDKTLFCASAVIIEPKVIVTAAHVVKNYKECIVKINNKQYIVESIVWPEEFDENIFGMNDIAMGFLKEEISLDFYPDLYDQDDELNKLCCISGFGLTGNFNTGAIKSDSKRRAGSNIIDDIQKQLLICRPSKPNDTQRTSLEFLIASGDSGGGLFIDGKLAGINSCIMSINKKVNADYNTESGHTRISVHRKWILDNIKKHGNRGLTRSR